MELERLLRSQGFGSRADCRALVRAGRVRIGDEVCDDPFQEIAPDGLSFSVDGTPWVFRPQAYLVLYKPADYECSHKPRFHPSVYSLLPRPLVTRGVQAVGRLDEDTTGLLLLSDDGQFIHRCTSPKKRVAKIYEVTTKHPVDDMQIAALLGGVLLNDDPEPVAALACERIADNLLRLTITEGKYHQVKRMIASVSNRVEGLHRSAIGDYTLPADLKPGEWRWLDATDLARIETPLDAA